LSSYLHPTPRPPFFLLRDNLTSLPLYHDEKNLSYHSLVSASQAFEALQEWHERCPIGYHHVFPHLKNGEFFRDAPIAKQTVTHILKQTQQATNISFSIRDAKKTFSEKTVCTSIVHMKPPEEGDK
jgi:hypothetical protein